MGSDADVGSTRTRGPRSYWRSAGAGYSASTVPPRRHTQIPAAAAAMLQSVTAAYLRVVSVHSVDLAGILRGRMASAEGGSVPNEVGYGEGCPLSSRLGGLGSVVSSPSSVRGRAPAENGFWRILKATERSFLYLYDKNLRGTICTSVPYSKFWGDLSPASPRDLCPCQRGNYVAYRCEQTRPTAASPPLTGCVQGPTPA